MDAETTVDKETLGARVRRLRDSRGLTRRELADAVTRAGGRPLGVDTLITWEGVRGPERSPGAHWIAPLASALGVSCDYLLTGVVGERHGALE